MAITRSQTKSGYARLVKPDFTGRKGNTAQGWFSNEKLYWVFLTVIAAGVFYVLAHCKCILKTAQRLVGDITYIVHGSSVGQAERTEAVM